MTSTAAIISGAALLNALEITGKHIGKVRVVINGAGASGTACAEHYVRLGVKRENIVLCDSMGVIYKGRTAGMNGHKGRFARSMTAWRCVSAGTGGMSKRAA
jgi:malate dehydrogenase (oxaloacetate-decarboxylating)(NADP+)